MDFQFVQQMYSTVIGECILGGFDWIRTCILEKEGINKDQVEYDIIANYR